MNRLSVIVFTILATGMITGCSSRGVYEGIQQQEAIRSSTPSGQPAPLRPGYDEYESERRKTDAATNVR